MVNGIMTINPGRAEINLLIKNFNSLHTRNQNDFDAIRTKNVCFIVFLCSVYNLLIFL